MTFEYVEVEEAMARSGLRMVVVGNIPSNWSEAAKGIFHVKGLPWSAVRLRYDDPQLKRWTGGLNAPVLMHDDARPRRGWAEILLLAERLAPEPALLPGDAAQRAWMLGLIHELCGEEGLAWARRLHLVHVGLHGRGGFPEPIAAYLGHKYGYRPDHADRWGRRVNDILRLLTTLLRNQRDAGSRYLLGDGLTALDIYAATAMAPLAPLPEPQCVMDPVIRAAFEHRDEALEAALDPLLLEHRDMIYAEHLELPLRL